MPLYNFHSHTVLSDGGLHPLELLRRAVAKGYTGFAVTDHGGLADLEWLADQLGQHCRLAREQWGMEAIPGVELTYVPPPLIPEAARRAREVGLELVVVHGETIVEPVEPGTNRAALSSPHVDILGHPGLLSEEEAQMAADRGIFLEISSRRGHSLANALVAQRATVAGARLILDSDAHSPEDLFDQAFARKVLLGAGVPEERLDEVLHENPRLLLEQIRSSR
jgi:histidinol phosphatase-like PHP family hydrolase